jgi:hypothetical protein
MYLNSFFSYFYLDLYNQYSIHESYRFMRVAETSNSHFQFSTLKVNNGKWDERSNAKSNLSLSMNLYNHSFISFSNDYMRNKKNINNIEFAFSFFSIIASEKRNIIEKFPQYFLLYNTNKNYDILRTFYFIFAPRIQIKIKLFFRSLFFFSSEGYKQKERYYLKVSSCFLFDNTNKNTTLIGYVFKVVSYPEKSMRDLIYQNSVKTPAENPPNETSMKRGVGRVRVRVFQVDTFNSLIFKYNQLDCFIFLILKKQSKYLNKTAIESLIQSLVNDSDENYSNVSIYIVGRYSRDNALIIFIFNSDYSFLSLGYDEMSFLEGKEESPKDTISIRK